MAQFKILFQNKTPHHFSNMILTSDDPLTLEFVVMSFKQRETEISSVSGFKLMPLTAVNAKNKIVS